MEVWRDVLGYEGLYQVSNFGAVKSIDRIVYCGNKPKQIKGKSIKPYSSKVPYLRVCLYLNGIRHQELIHRLVAQSFVPNPLNKPIINHLDNNPQNNDATNLEWVTQSENIKYSYKQGRSKSPFSERGKYAYATDKMRIPVVGVDKKTGATMEFISISAAGRNGFNTSSICKCCKGRRSTHAGKIWRYA